MTHHVRFLRGPFRLAAVASAAVAAAAFDQQAAGEEDGVGGGQLLPQVDRVVAEAAAVPLDVVVETVKFSWIGEVGWRGWGSRNRAG